MDVEHRKITYDKNAIQKMFSILASVRENDPESRIGSGRNKKANN
jgi:hypothetical protein